jgi:hypothetical protein
VVAEVRSIVAGDQRQAVESRRELEGLVAGLRQEADVLRQDISRLHEEVAGEKRRRTEERRTAAGELAEVERKLASATIDAKVSSKGWEGGGWMWRSSRPKPVFFFFF